MQIHSDLESSSRFWDFFWSSRSFPHLVLWWEGQNGFLWELLQTWRSSKMQVILPDFVNTPLPAIIRTRGWESLLERPSRCPVVFIQVFYSNIHGIDTFVPQFATTFRGTRIVDTLDLISEILHVPRVVYPDYPGYDRLQTMFRDKILSHFCKTPSIWGGKLNTPCSGFAKGPRFLTWWWHSLSLHYLTITSSLSLVLVFFYLF